MALSDPKDIFNTTSGVGFKSVDSDANFLYAIVATGDNKFRKYSLATLAASGADVTVMSQPSDICLVGNGASAAVVSNSTNQINVIEISSGFNSAIVTNVQTTYTGTIGQQIAFNRNTGTSLITRGTNQQLTLLNANNTCTLLTPASGLTGIKASVLITKTASTGNGDDPVWIVGTNGGTILEITQIGVVTKLVTLPTTPNVGTAPVQVVTGLSYQFPYLLVATNFGVQYFYNWSTNALISKQLIADGTSATSGPILCAASSGHTLMGFDRVDGSQNHHAITEIFFNSTTPIYNWLFNDANIVTNTLKLNGANSLAFEVKNTSANIQLRTYKISLNGVTEQAELHNPPGTIVSGRIIRIRSERIGQTCIESDTNIPAANTLINCTEDRRYIDLAIDGTGKWDIREFKK